ncbi:MAG: SEL1-like repeat protein [Gammaproteobacteria bacterium]|jgi:TPR repeat protein
MAAFRGDAEAQYRLGEVLRRGLLGQTVDERQARYWYNRAARGGHRSAAFLVNNWRNRHHFK